MQKYHTKKNKKAFSLLEIIILLMVIITVATITVPIVRLNYEKKSLFDNFKLMLLEINLSLNLSVIENDSVKKWDLFEGDIKKNLNTYFKPYFTDTSTVNCSLYKHKIRNLYGDEVISACDMFQGNIVKFKQSFFGINNVDTKNKVIKVVLDTNGIAQPNMLGRDIFMLKINDSIYESAEPTGVMNQNCSTNLVPRTGIIQGEGCVDRLMTEGFMGY